MRDGGPVGVVLFPAHPGGGGAATNQKAVRDLWAAAQQTALHPRLQYLLLTVVCANRQANLTGKSVAEGKIAQTAAENENDAANRCKDMLRSFEQAWSSAKPPKELVSSLATTALAVDPDRNATCNPAGAVLPKDWLREPQRSEFWKYEQRIKSGADQLPLPPFCFMVAPTDEPRLRELLLESQMVVLADESEISRTSSGRLMIG